MTVTKPFTFTETIAAAAAAVYQALTSQASLTSWLCSSALVNVTEGGSLFLNWNRPNYYAVGQYETLEPAQQVVFSWHGKGEPAPTRVTISIEESAQQIHLTLRHEGIGDGAEWAEARRQIEEGWHYSLSNLKQVLEIGFDRRVYDRPFLGIWIAGPVDAAQREQLGIDRQGGIRITGTVPGSGANAVGLQDQDIITRIGDFSLPSFSALQNAMRDREIDEAVPIEYFRDGAAHTADMTLKKRPFPNLPDSAAALADALQSQYDTVATQLDALIEGVAEQDANHAEEGGWNVKVILAHLLTTERGMQMSIASNIDNNQLTGWPNNPTAWMQAYADVYTLPQLADALRHSLAETVALIRNLPDEVVQRKATFYAIGQTMLGLVGHIQGHFVEAQQAIDRARAAHLPAA